MAAAICCTAPLAQADDELLTIGSKAPGLDIEHWVSDGNGKFKPVKEFEKGKVYVVEFWATWCGPCIGSMPHLAETQKSYAKRGVQLISVSDEDLDTVTKFLERPFESDEEKGARRGRPPPAPPPWPRALIVASLPP
ncbi:MAG: TlpA disulfide reductase family protein, partial [Planctomycetota bacterium]